MKEVIFINLFNLMARISLDDRQFNRGVNNSERSFTGLGKTIGGVIAGLGITKLAKDTIKLGIDTNAMAETSGIAWETLLGSQEASKKMLDDIAKFAATTPFEKMGVDNMAKQLHNAGLSGDGLFQQLTKFGDIGGAFGIQSASLEEMVRQYSQVQQAGVAYTEDLNILQDRGVPIYKALSETLGISTADVKKWASEGKISAEVYQEALDNVAKGVEGGMAAQSKSFSGMVSTFKDGIGELAGILAKPIFDGIKSALETIQPKLDTFIKVLGEEGLSAALDSISPGLSDLVNNLGLIASIVGGAALAINGFNLAMAGFAIIQSVVTGIQTYMGAVKGATLAQTLFNIATNLGLIPLWVVVGVIGAVAGAFIYLWNTSDSFRNFWIGLWEGIKTICTNTWEGLKKFFTETIPNIINNISTWFSELPGKIKAWFDRTVEKASNWLTQMKQKAQETAQGFVSKAVEFIQRLPGKIWNFLKQCIDKATQWASDMGSKASQAARNMVNNVVNGIKSLPSKVFSIGKDIVKGLWNGITGMGGWLYGKVRGFATGILDNMKAALGIHSPSREAKKQVGQWIPPGITEGFEDQLPKMDRQIKSGMANMIKSAASFDLSPITNGLNLASAVDIGSINPKGVSPLSTPQTNQTFNNTFNFTVEGDIDRNKMQEIADYVQESIARNIRRDRMAIGQW